jgi:hypothetical protein
MANSSSDALKAQPLSGYILALLFVGLLFFALSIVSLVQLLNMTTVDDRIEYFMTTILLFGTAVFFLGEFTALIIVRQLKRRSHFQSILKNPLYDLFDHHNGLKITPTETEDVNKPYLKSSYILTAWKVHRLVKKKAKLAGQGQPFRGTVRLKYLRELGDDRIGDAELLLPISTREMEKIQKYVLKHFIAPTELTPIGLIVTKHGLGDPFLARLLNKYTLELHVS